MLWLFQFSDDEEIPGITSLIIVSEAFFKQNGSLDDSHITDQIGSNLPEGFFEEAESFFTTEYDVETAREKLLAAGVFEERTIF